MITTNRHIRIAVDWENYAAEWWDSARLRQDAPIALRGLLADVATSEIVVTGPRVARTLLAWCESVPGWNSGPEYAPHPLTFETTP